MHPRKEVHEKSRGLALDLLGEFPGNSLVEESPGGGASWEETEAEGNVQLFLRGLEEGCTQHFGFWQTMGIGKENE